MNMLDIEPGLATTMSGGPAEAMVGIEPEPTLVLDLMGKGAVLEKDPAPVASIIATQPAAEAILNRMALAQEMEGGDPESGDRFVPYALTGDPEEIFGGITILGQDPESVESAKTFVTKLLGAIERPEEGQAETDAQELGGEEPRNTGQDDQKEQTGRGKNLLMAFRRSKLARAAATVAAVGSGLMYWASSASGETLEQECVDAGMKPIPIKGASVHHVHKNDGNGWYIRVALGKLGAMPAECAQNGIYRVMNNRVQEQNGHHPQQWIMVSPWVGSRWNGHRNNRGIVDVDGSAGRGGTATYENISYQHNHNWTNFQYNCSPGPAKTGFRFQQMNTVIQTDPGNIGEDPSKINGTIKVLSGPTISDHSMKVYGAC